MNADGKHERTGGFALARFEAWALPRLAGMLPARVMPDHMTFLGLGASTGVAIAYVLSNQSLDWLWVASGLLVVHAADKKRTGGSFRSQRGRLVLHV